MHRTSKGQGAVKKPSSHRDLPANIFLFGKNIRRFPLAKWANQRKPDYCCRMKCEMSIGENGGFVKKNLPLQVEGFKKRKGRQIRLPHRTKHPSLFSNSGRGDLRPKLKKSLFYQLQGCTEMQ